MKLNQCLSYIFAVFLSSLLFTTPAMAELYDDMINAVKAGNINEVETILDMGVDVNSVDRDGNTLLIIAIAEEKEALVLQLLTRKPDLEKVNRFGDTALKLAALKGLNGTVQALVQNGAKVENKGWTPLIYAAFNGKMDIVSYLIKHGANVNAQSPSGISPLMAAARNGHIEVVKYLLSQGADASLVSNNNETAVQLAQKNSHTDIIKLINQAPKPETITIKISK